VSEQDQSQAEVEQEVTQDQVADEQRAAVSEDTSAEAPVSEEAPADGEAEKGDGAQEEAAVEVVCYTEEELPALVESLLFAYGEPLSSQRIAEIARADETIIDGILLTLIERTRAPEYGVELVRIAEKYQFRSKSRFAPAIRELKAGKPKRLSGAALETLAIIAYRQPVVKSDVEKIRGVDVSPTLKTLIERGFVKIIGHQSTVGQPALYGTTDEFLKIFGLNSLSELPSLREVAEFEMEPGEASEPEAAEEPQSAAVQ